MKENKTANIEGITQRQAIAIELKLKDGKTIRQIAKELNTSPSTISRDLCALRQDDTYAQYLEDLKLGSLDNAVMANMVTSKYLSQVFEKENIGHLEASTANTIGSTSQKTHAFLEGRLSDDRGGANLTDAQLEKIING